MMIMKNLSTIVEIVAVLTIFGYGIFIAIDMAGMEKDSIEYLNGRIDIVWLWLLLILISSPRGKTR